MPKAATLELVHYPKIRHINIILNEIILRSYHEHSETELLAVLRGSVEVRFSSGVFTLREGEFAVFNSKEAHRIDGQGTKPLTLVLQYSPYLCREYYPHARRMIFRSPYASADLDAERNRELLRQVFLTSLAYFDSDRLFELRCLSSLLALIAELGASLPCDYLNPEQHHSRLDKVHKLDLITSYMQEKYQSPLRLEEVAEIAGMTPSYLSHFFRENMGLSFQNYLNELRFENALRVMDRSLPLKDIALGSGFSDAKYLSRMFQKKMGCSPMEYRRQLAASKSDARLRPRYNDEESVLSEADSFELLSALLSG